MLTNRFAVDSIYPESRRQPLRGLLPLKPLDGPTAKGPFTDSAILGAKRLGIEKRLGPAWTSAQARSGLKAPAPPKGDLRRGALASLGPVKSLLASPGTSL